jgi:hypothetical protein
MVGKAPAQRFTVYTDVLISRSGFFKAARKPEWTDATKATCLEDDEPTVFTRYLNCVYFGVKTLNLDGDAPEDDREPYSPPEDLQLRPDAFDRAGSTIAEEYGLYHVYVQQCFIALAEVYLLADRLQDLETANLIIDELIRFAASRHVIPWVQVANLVYESTVHGNPFRKLLRDYCVYETHGSDYMEMYISGWPSELTRDVTAEFMRLMDCSKEESVIKMQRNVRTMETCHYHQHGKDHPRCLTETKKPRLDLRPAEKPATEPSVGA